MLPKLIVGTVDVTTRREIAQHLAENAISVVAKTTLAKCVNPQVKDLKSLSQSVTQESLRQATGRCTQCKFRVQES